MSNFATSKSDNRNIRVLQFLEAYERQESLWNPSLESYKNKSARDDAYMRIIDELKLPTLTINDVKLKVKSIRTTYKKEVRLVKKHKEEGKPYNPKLFWFSRADSFLRNVSISRQKNSQNTCVSQPSENLNKVDCKSFMIDYIETTDRPSHNEETSDNLVDTIEEDGLNNSCEGYDFKTHSSVIDGQSQENMEILETSIDENGPLTTSTICRNNHNDFLLKCSSDEKTSLNASRESHEAHSTVNCSGNSIEDEYDFFCRSVAMQLRSIRDNYSRCVAKLKIQQILFEAETGHYKNSPCITIPVCQNINNISNL